MSDVNDYQLRPSCLVRDELTGRLVEGGLYSQRESDLHHLRIPCDGQQLPDSPDVLKDYSGTFHPSAVRVYHRELESRLTEHIDAADVVFGAVAWLTHPGILDHLRTVRHVVSIVVQKEGYLRPDVGERANFSKRLRQRYESLSGFTSQYMLPGIARHLCVCTSINIQPVRCVGNHNRDRRPAFPRMHNKFLVFGRVQVEGGEYGRIQPYAVWTGSFNLTANATRSFENAVYIECPQVAEAYANEWSQILALSEPLNWESDWCAPEFRIGT